MTPDMFPVRVIVESVRPQHCLTCAHDGHQLLDTFAIVSGQTMLGQLVDTVLSALGLPQLIQDSRGLIQINNWKPLTFEAITDNKEEPVANLFKEISSNIILKILTKHSSADPQNTQCITDIKHRLLKIAMEKQPHILTTMDNQEIKEVIQQLISAEDESPCSLSAESVMAINEWLDQISSESTNHKSTIQATRCFNVIEIAKLERWFLHEQNPQRPKLMSYMHALNSSPYRRSGNKVTYQQICNWFTNQRAVLRKQQQIAHNLQQQVMCNGSGGAAGAGLAAMAVTEFQQLRNAFPTLINTGVPTNNNMTAGDATMTEPSSSNGDRTLTNSTNASATNTTTTTAASSTASATSPAATTVASTAGATDIPLATTPLDIASKFNGANAYNPLIDGHGNHHSHHHRHGDGERIDGGSESPNGNDDVSVQSASEENGYELDIKESGTSSPAEMLDVGAMSPSNPQSAMSDLFRPLSNGNGVSMGGGTADLNGQIPSAVAAIFGLASGGANDGNGASSAADFARAQQCGAADYSRHSADFVRQNHQNSTLMAAFSSLMPSFLNGTAQFNSSFLNGGGIPPQAGSPISSSASSNNGGGHFGSSLLKPMPSSSSSGGFRDENGVKMETPTNNNNSTTSNNNNNNNNSTARSRLMFDPLSELPVLERWFEENPHPGCLQIEQYTDMLNACHYRQNYPPISTHNVKIWFKNRRAKCKRLNLGGDVSSTPKPTALSA